MLLWEHTFDDLAWRDLLTEVHQALDKLRAEVLGGEISDVDLSWSVEELQKVENGVVAEKLRRLGAFDERQAHLAAGARSAGDWAARSLNITFGQGKAMADTADRMLDLPETADKFAQGEPTTDHATCLSEPARPRGLEGGRVSAPRTGWRTSTHIHHHGWEVVRDRTGHFSLAQPEPLRHTA